MLKPTSRSLEISLPSVRAGWLIGLASALILVVVALILLPARQPSARMADVAHLPRINAMLNSATVLLLLAGYLLIRRQRVRLHRLCMLSAFLLSTLFLISYVIYHIFAGSTTFGGPDWARPIYYPILVSHIVLAMALLPLSLLTLYRAWQRMFALHRRLAPWTFFLWIYVSVSGVVVYWMLYHLPG